jgi:hypothetical protein
MKSGEFQLYPYGEGEEMTGEVVKERLPFF